MSHRPGSRSAGRVLRLASGVALVGLLAACSGSAGTPSGAVTPVSGGSGTPATADPGAQPVATATDLPTDVSSQSPSTPADEQGGSVPTSTDDVVAEDVASPDRTAVLSAVRAGAHDGYDRVVLEFDGPVSGYVVRYVDPLTSDPEGSPVEHGGAAALQVVAMGATLDTASLGTPEGAPRAYAGPATIKAGLTSVQDVVQAGDFEATLSLGIGVTAQKPFAVQLLQNPTRIVVDVAH